MEDKETQHAEAQQTILQMSTEKAQKTILSNKPERVFADSPMMFRCSDCFERLYVTVDCAYETPKNTQLDTQSIKTTAVSTEHLSSLSIRELDQFHTAVKTDDLQMNIDSDSEDEHYSAKSTNVRLMSYFNQSIDETTQSDDYEDSEEVIKLEIRRVTRRQENEEYASVSDDFKLYNVLYKRNIYEPKIRMVPPKIGSMVRQKHPNNSVFTTPKRLNKNVTPTESLVTNEQHNKHSIVIADNEELTLLSALHNGISTISKDEQEDINDTSEFANKYEIFCEKELSQNRIWTLENKLDNLKHLSDLSVVSIIKFCSDYCRYALSISEPVKIQNYINNNVKIMFESTKTVIQ